MQEETEKLETQELIIKPTFENVTENEAQILAEENFIFCDFEDNEPVVLKLGKVEVFRVYSYSGLLKNLSDINNRFPNSTVTLYLVDDELQEEEAFLKVKLCQPSTDTTNNNENPVEATVTEQMQPSL